MGQAKPDFKELKKKLPEIDDKIIKDHLERLDTPYYSRYEINAIANHIRAIADLNSKTPVKILINTEKEGFSLTLVSFDFPYAFSLITGILGSVNFDIRWGHIFTYTKAETENKVKPLQQRQSRYHIKINPLTQKKIIDSFTGLCPTHSQAESLEAQLLPRFQEIFQLLIQRTPEKLEQAKKQVNEWVAQSLYSVKVSDHKILYPLHLELDNSSKDKTALKVISQNTPVFLYALSNALSLQRIQIEEVLIQTQEERILDLFHILDSRGKKVEDPLTMNQVKLAVLLTKQFTYFLTQAPNPFSALTRFETLLKDILELPQTGKWVEMLSEPRIMKDLARLLGASDFLWEDFIRLQYENLLPMLDQKASRQRFSSPLENLQKELDKQLEQGKTLGEKKRILNEFKDREIYLIDLDHILAPEQQFEKLSEHLSYLAEIVVRAALSIAWNALTPKYGTPKSIAGIDAQLAVLGLGKLGGAALGYASDIELLFVYSDQGKTTGPEKTDNSFFFEQIVQTTRGLIQAKREGIFDVDLRLRPFGKDGVLACSLASFIEYFSANGQAAALERMALVRLRYIAGSQELGMQIERLRDEFIYFAKAKVDLAELRYLRTKQFETKTTPGVVNAKFSPGTLADLEYDVQILQVQYGSQYPELRTPRIHQALRALVKAGLLGEIESRQLSSSYDFFRKLINGLRMLRGSAKDLVLPAPHSIEFRHLARRIGYEQQGELDPSTQLHLDIETNRALVRNFVEKHFGRESLPGPKDGNLADLILSENPDLELQYQILGSTGFTNLRRAFTNLELLAGKTQQRESFTRLSVLVQDVMRQQADPDMALNNWEQFVQKLPDITKHYQTLLSQPVRLKILLNLFSTSQYFSQILINYPALFEIATNPDHLEQVRTRKELITQLTQQNFFNLSQSEYLNRLRFFKMQETLRVGVRDICLKKSLIDVTHEISLIAEVLIETALKKIWHDKIRELKIPANFEELPLTIFAFGKLGGNELNYSSDIDLMAVFFQKEIDQILQWDLFKAYEIGSKLLEQLVADLSIHTALGHCYRVDLRLRPYGDSGKMVQSEASIKEYYLTTARLWEKQALLKLRPVAGNRQRGLNLYTELLSTVFNSPLKTKDIVASIDRMRNEKIKQESKKINHQGIDLKNGIGGIRDIEFLAQGLSLIHGQKQKNYLTGNTLIAFREFKNSNLIELEKYRCLRDNYIFLRRLEHFLQIYENRQVHHLPTSEKELHLIARRCEGPQVKLDQFLLKVERIMKENREAYNHFLLSHL